MTQLITPLLFFLITVAQALHSPGYRFGLENRQRDTVKVDSKYGPFYFNQRVDHSSDNATTFPQRIWANADWYKPNGPVIFYNAGEVDADQTGRSNYVVNSSMALLARELNGVVIVLEHRFYGQSMPAPDFSTENLKTLTIQNSMEDMVNVIKTFQIPTLGRTLPPPETRWIVYGGSYSGNLAAWLHQAHPDLVYATVVSSAPVQLRMDFYEYYDPIIRYGPTYCIDALENVIRYVDQFMFSNNPTAIAQLKSYFGFDTTIEDDDFVSQLTGPYGLWQQMSPTSDPFGDFCTIFNGTSSTADQVPAFAGYIRNLNSPCRGYNDYCYSTHHPNNYMFTNTQNSYRAWMYQVCTDFGYWQSGNVPAGQPTIVSRKLQIELNMRQCEYYFGLKDLPAVDANNEKYGGWNIKLNRTIWVDGEWDPWRTLSVNSAQAPEHNTTGLEVLYHILPKSVHHWDFFTGPSVDADIKQFQDTMVQLMKKWVSE